LPQPSRAKNPSLTDGFREGDLLHLKAQVAGRPKGTVLPVLGYCLRRCPGPAPRLTGLRAALPRVRHHLRRPRSRPLPGAKQRERWLGSIQLYFSEIDLTDHAHELVLERRREGLVIAMYPERQQHQLAA
jgi:hypothetical protein